MVSKKRSFCSQHVKLRLGWARSSRFNRFDTARLTDDASRRDGRAENLLAMAQVA
jgi:hypothetical protein